MEAILEKMNTGTNLYKTGEMKVQQKIFTAFCITEGLPVPEAEYQFHEERKWRIDYFFENEENGKKVALEVEGGVWNYGRHNRAEGFLRDMEKYNALATQGIFLLRVLPKNLITTDTIEMIRKTLI